MNESVDLGAVQRFLAQHRIAVVGASADRRNFGNTVYRAFRDHGYEVVAVNPAGVAVEGDVCHPDLDSVPGELDGAVVMVNRSVAAEVVRACARRGVTRVWLFKGVGGPGAVSEEALEACRAAGMDVVAGACPLMFLEPVGWFHRVHRTVRRSRGALRRVA